MLRHVRQQVGALRHRHLGRRGGRRRAPVGGEVDQRGVGLVADGAHHRGLAGDQGAGHIVLSTPDEAAAIMADDLCVQARMMRVDVNLCHGFPGDSLPAPTQ